MEDRINGWQMGCNPNVPHLWVGYVPLTYIPFTNFLEHPSTPVQALDVWVWELVDWIKHQITQGTDSTDKRFLMGVN